MQLMCSDCLVEEGLQIKAITVTNGFAFCHNHLSRFLERCETSNRGELELFQKYFDREVSVLQDDPEDEDPTGLYVG